MRIGHRQFMTAFPAVLGLLTVVGVAFRDQRASPVPDGLLVMRMLACMVLLGMAWHSARYFDALSCGREPQAV